METVYDRIKRMTPEELRIFIYWVYRNGNEDGMRGLCDSESGYFGGHVLFIPASELFSNDDVENDLWDRFEEIYRNND